MEDLDGEGATWYCEARGVAIEAGELIRGEYVTPSMRTSVIPSRHSLSLRSRLASGLSVGTRLQRGQVRSTQNTTNERTLAEQTHEDVGTKGTLMCFVKDDDTVAVEVAFVKRLAEEDTICHV